MWYSTNFEWKLTFVGEVTAKQLQKLNIMPKVKLLKQVGDHTVGTELDIEDPTVIAKWEELGVIAKPKATKEKKAKTVKIESVEPAPKKSFIQKLIAMITF